MKPGRQIELIDTILEHIISDDSAIVPAVLDKVREAVEAAAERYQARIAAKVETDLG